MDALVSFGFELRRRRAARGLSLLTLSRLVNYSKGHLSNVERGARSATIDLARRCDAALDTGGELARLLNEPAPPDPAANGWHRPTVWPAQLPPVTADFVGRGSTIATLDRLVPGRAAAAEIILFDGGPGMGKTTLALHWAHRIREYFPDGALYANLRGFDPSNRRVEPANALAVFLQGLGVSVEAIPAETDARTALLRSLLNGRRVILVLDNVANVDQVRPLLGSR